MMAQLRILLKTLMASSLLILSSYCQSPSRENFQFSTIHSIPSTSAGKRDTKDADKSVGSQFELGLDSRIGQNKPRRNYDSNNLAIRTYERVVLEGSRVRINCPHLTRETPDENGAEDAHGVWHSSPRHTTVEAQAHQQTAGTAQTKSGQVKWFRNHVPLLNLNHFQHQLLNYPPTAPTDEFGTSVELASLQALKAAPDVIELNQTTELSRTTTSNNQLGQIGTASPTISGSRVPLLNSVISENVNEPVDRRKLVNTPRQSSSLHSNVWAREWYIGKFGELVINKVSQHHSGKYTCLVSGGQSEVLLDVLMDSSTDAKQWKAFLGANWLEPTIVEENKPGGAKQASGLDPSVDMKSHSRSGLVSQESNTFENVPIEGQTGRLLDENRGVGVRVENDSRVDGSSSIKLNLIRLSRDYPMPVTGSQPASISMLSSPDGKSSQIAPPRFVEEETLEKTLAPATTSPRCGRKSIQLDVNRNRQFNPVHLVRSEIIQWNDLKSVPGFLYTRQQLHCPVGVDPLQFQADAIVNALYPGNLRLTPDDDKIGLRLRYESFAKRLIYHIATSRQSNLNCPPSPLDLIWLKDGAELKFDSNGKESDKILNLRLINTSNHSSDGGNYGSVTPLFSKEASNSKNVTRFLEGSKSFGTKLECPFEGQILEIDGMRSDDAGLYTCAFKLNVQKLIESIRCPRRSDGQPELDRDNHKFCCDGAECSSAKCDQISKQKAHIERQETVELNSKLEDSEPEKSLSFSKKLILDLEAIFGMAPGHEQSLDKVERLLSCLPDTLTAVQNFSLVVVERPAESCSLWSAIVQANIAYARRKIDDYKRFKSSSEVEQKLTDDVRWRKLSSQSAPSPDKRFTRGLVDTFETSTGEFGRTLPAQLNDQERPEASEDPYWRGRRSAGSAIRSHSDKIGDINKPSNLINRLFLASLDSRGSASLANSNLSPQFSERHSLSNIGIDPSDRSGTLEFNHESKKRLNSQLRMHVRRKIGIHDMIAHRKKRSSALQKNLDSSQGVKTKDLIADDGSQEIHIKPTSRDKSELNARSGVELESEAADISSDETLTSIINEGVSDARGYGQAMNQASLHSHHRLVVNNEASDTVWPTTSDPREDHAKPGPLLEDSLNVLSSRDRLGDSYPLDKAFYEPTTSSGPLSASFIASVQMRPNRSRPTLERKISPINLDTPAISYTGTESVPSSARYNEALIRSIEPITTGDSIDANVLWAANRYLYMHMRAIASSPIFGAEVDVEWSNERTNYSSQQNHENAALNRPNPQTGELIIDTAPFATIDMISGQNLLLQCTAQALGRLPEVKWYKRIYSSEIGHKSETKIRKLADHLYWPLTELDSFKIKSHSDKKPTPFVCSESTTIFDNLANQTFTVVNSLLLSSYNDVEGGISTFSSHYNLYACIVDADVRHNYATLGVNLRETRRQIPYDITKRFQARSIFTNTNLNSNLAIKSLNNLSSARNEDNEHYSHFRQRHIQLPLESHWIPIFNSVTDRTHTIGSSISMIPIYISVVIALVFSSLLAIVYLTLKSYKTLSRQRSQDEYCDLKTTDINVGVAETVGFKTHKLTQHQPIRGMMPVECPCLFEFNPTSHAATISDARVLCTESSLYQNCDHTKILKTNYNHYEAHSHLIESHCPYYDLGTVQVSTTEFKTFQKDKSYGRAIPVGGCCDLVATKTPAHLQVTNMFDNPLDSG